MKYYSIVDELWYNSQEYKDRKEQMKSDKEIFGNESEEDWFSRQAEEYIELGDVSGLVERAERADYYEGQLRIAYTEINKLQPVVTLVNEYSPHESPMLTKIWLEIKLSK